MQRGARACSAAIVLALARLSRSPVLQAVSWVYIWLFRSVPLIVRAALPLQLQRPVPDARASASRSGPAFVTLRRVTTLATDMVVAVVGLSLNEAAYAAEVVRGGHPLGRPGPARGGRRAGPAPRLPVPPDRACRRRCGRSCPTYVNQLIGLIKGTSLVFYVSLLDLFGSVQSMGSTYPGDIVPLLLVATVWYVVLTSVVSVVQFYVERHFARGAVRTLPPTPLQRLRAGLRTCGRDAGWPPYDRETPTPRPPPRPAAVEVHGVHKCVRRPHGCSTAST